MNTVCAEHSGLDKRLEGVERKQDELSEEFKNIYRLIEKIDDKFDNYLPKNITYLIGVLCTLVGGLAVWAATHVSP
ncbi:MAG: hypothetical protein ACFFC6_11355 [Promethearchaeota archaeon]